MGLNEAILTEVQQKLYDEIINQYNSLLIQTNKKEAIDLIITSLAINLGSILSQIPDDYRSSYVNITLKLVSESVSACVEDADKSLWGQIGHA